MTEKQYLEIISSLKGIIKKISKINTHPISQTWLTKTQVKQIFEYSDSSLKNIEPFLKISQTRARRFYSTKSVLGYIESNIKNEKDVR
jgi:hypothetical protein